MKKIKRTLEQYNKELEILKNKIFCERCAVDNTSELLRTLMYLEKELKNEMEKEYPKLNPIK